MSRFAFALATLVAMLLGACGSGSGGGPPAILYGEDICDRCRMVISESRHAAGATLDGVDYRFDDPGCLRGFLAEAEESTAKVWAHDENETWRPAQEAWFVIDPDRATPMGSGILAFGSEAAAAAAAERLGAEPLRWADLPASAE